MAQFDNYENISIHCTSIQTPIVGHKNKLLVTVQCTKQMPEEASMPSNAWNKLYTVIWQRITICLGCPLERRDNEPLRL